MFKRLTVIILTMLSLATGFAPLVMAAPAMNGALAGYGMPQATRVASASPVAADAKVVQVLHMVATAYGPSYRDNYPYGATNYYGAPLKPGDVAVDPSVIPLGTKLRICGYHTALLPGSCMTATADDEGGAIRGMHVDIFIDGSDALVSRFGIQNVTVSVLQ